MSHTVVRPLLRRAPGRKSQPVRATRPVERIARQALIERRDRCMAEVARFWSEPGSLASLYTKARQLLTRHWSASSWRGRADLLRTAEWLVGVGKRSAESASCEQWHSTRGHLPTNEKPNASTHMAIAITDVHLANVR
jgi:hypothetical protein